MPVAGPPAVRRGIRPVGPIGAGDPLVGRAAVGDDVSMSDGAYAAAYERSTADPEGFWAEAAEAIEWTRPADRVLDDSNPPFHRWFRGGRLNTCFNAVDRHVRDGRGDQVAIHYD